MARGEVVDEVGRQINAETAYRVGACIFYYRELNNETIVPFAEQILYQDEHFLVADKPHFLPVVPAGKFLRETLLVRLRKRGAPDDLVPVHRLDRETAGVVLFSTNAKTRGCYTSLFRNQKVTKIYEAIGPTSGELSFPLTRRSRIIQGNPFFRMKESPGEINATTEIDILGNEGSISRYQLVPLTGKKHQLRVHLATLGIPIINDRFYPLLTPDIDDDFSRPLKLLAKSISFQDPLTKKRHYFESGRTL